MGDAPLTDGVDSNVGRGVDGRITPASGADAVHDPLRKPWREVAAVTRCAMDVPFPPMQPNQLLFNVSLMPYATHPLVSARGQTARRQLSALRLADYLNKTERVELHVVNRAIEQMLDIPGMTSVSRGDLLAIYTDEGFHTWMMERFRQQLLTRTGYALVQAPSLSVARVLALCEAVNESHRGIAVVAAASVTETLITGTLRRAGACDDVYPPVRAMLDEHAADEMRHQAAFVRFMGEWVPSLSFEDRAFLDILLPELMLAFLAPELPAWRSHLCSVGLDPAEADQVLRESIDPLETGVQMMEAALVPRRLFERLGMACAERFARKVSRWRPP